VTFVIVYESCSCLWRKFSDFHDHLLILFCSVLCLSFYLRSSCSPWSIPCSSFIFGLESSGTLQDRASLGLMPASDLKLESSARSSESFTVFIFSPILSRSKLAGATSQVSSVCYWFSPAAVFRSGLHLCR
jgi:hypothetical protein